MRAAEIIRPRLDIRSVVNGTEDWSKDGFDQLKDFTDFDQPRSLQKVADEEERAVRWGVDVVRNQIRWALAEGHIAAVGQQPDGELVAVPPAF